jgi:hypothetical protein
MGRQEKISSLCGYSKLPSFIANDCRQIEAASITHRHELLILGIYQKS